MTKNDLEMSEVLISVEAARFLDISTQKLNRLRQAGIINAKQLNEGEHGRLFAYKLADLRNIDPAILKPQKRGRKPKSKNP